jgi:NADH:ubiquinone oxidoreductase subunit E
MEDQIEAVIEQFSRDRGNLVPILNRVQETAGYLSPDAIAAISRFLEISPNEVYSVASFYPRFRFSPPDSGD